MVAGMPRRLARRLLALLAALVAAAACATEPPPHVTALPAQPCRPAKRVESKLGEARNFLLLRATLDGRPATLLLDTGAETSTLTPRAVAALHLRRDTAHGRTLAGVAGSVRADTVRVRDVALAGIVVARAQDMAIGELPSLEGLDPPVAGLLGADVLARFDMDLDAPAGRLALYAPGGCAGYLPWPGAAPLPLQKTRSGLAFVDAEVDGRRVRALLDTGARTSLLTRDAARALGVTARVLAGDEARTGSGVGNASLSLRRHRFATFGLPGALEHDATVNVADLPLPGVEMLLGADFLGRREVWIAYASGRLFLR
jgi:predicted aspartyl protease